MKQGTSEGSEWFHMNLRGPHWSFKINFGKYQSTSSWNLETRYSITTLTMLFSTNLFLFLLQILKISSKTNEGIDNTWHTLQKFKETMIENNAFQERRSAQQKAWMWQYIQHRLVESFRQNTDLQQKHIAYEALVSEGSLNPGVAADLLLADFWSKERVRWYQNIAVSKETFSESMQGWSFLPGCMLSSSLHFYMMEDLNPSGQLLFPTTKC